MNKKKFRAELAIALNAGELFSVWMMLPETWRNDVQELYSKAIGIIDKNLYNEIFVLINKVLAIAHKQQDKLPPEVGKFVPLADEIMKLLTELKLDDYDSAKGFVVGDFVKANGKRVCDFAWNMGEQFAKEDTVEFKEMLAGIIAKAKDVKECEADVNVGVDGDVEGEFLKVEGRWVPVDIAKQWTEMKKVALRRLNWASKMMNIHRNSFILQLLAIQDCISVGCNINFILEMMNDVFENIIYIMFWGKFKEKSLQRTKNPALDNEPKDTPQ